MSRKLVHIVDDEESIRHSTAFVLNSAGLPCVTWPSGKAFLAGAVLDRGGVAILDLQMPDLDGLTLQQELVASGSSISVIMVTGHGDVPSAVKALQSGAADFIEKPCDPDRLVTKVRHALDRQEEIHLRCGDAKERLSHLTPRESQVLTGLTEGKSNKQIAIDLGLSPRTVEMHRCNLMGRLGARSFSDAIRMAVSAGLS